MFGLIPPVSRLLRLTVEILRPVPAIAIVPIALLIFGFGYRLEIAIVAFACFFPLLILTESAVRQIAPRLIEVSRVLRLGQTQRLTKIVLPASLPRIFVALRLAGGVALIVAVTVEIAANPMGLGYRLMVAGQSLRPADMFATLIWIASSAGRSISRCCGRKRGCRRPGTRRMTGRLLWFPRQRRRADALDPRLAGDRRRSARVAGVSARPGPGLGRAGARISRRAT